MIRFYPGMDIEYQTFSIFSPDFESFLLDVVNNALQLEGIETEPIKYIFND